MADKQPRVALRNAREAAELLMDEAAKQAGITKSFWSYVESGTKKPSIKTARRMAKVVGIPARIAFPELVLE